MRPAAIQFIKCSLTPTVVFSTPPNGPVCKSWSSNAPSPFLICHALLHAIHRLESSAIGIDARRLLQIHLLGLCPKSSVEHIWIPLAELCFWPCFQLLPALLCMYRHCFVKGPAPYRACSGTGVKSEKESVKRRSRKNRGSWRRRLALQQTLLRTISSLRAKRARTCTS